MNYSKILSIGICTLLLFFLTSSNLYDSSKHSPQPDPQISIEHITALNEINAKLDTLLANISATPVNAAPVSNEYLKAAEGKVFSWWPAKTELNYNDLYSIINFVLTYCPVEITDKQGFTSLLIETIATESFFGSTNVQRRGAALGVIQMEPTTYSCIFDNYLKYNSELKKFVTQFKDRNMSDTENLKVNLQYQIALATVLYIRRNGHEKDLTTISSRYAVYKAIYNTNLGKATAAIYERNVDKYLSEYYASRI